MFSNGPRSTTLTNRNVVGSYGVFIFTSGNGLIFGISKNNAGFGFL